MKNKAMFIKKSISMLLAIAMLVSALSVVSVAAAETTGYYKTIASENYEEAKPVTQTNGFSVVTTLNNGSMGYLYSNPHTTGPVGANIPITGMEQNATYTYELDFYITKYSNDAGGCLIAPFVSGNNGYESQDWLGKDKYDLNQWYTYSKTFTTTKSYTNFKTTIHTYGEAVIIYDNLRILDENGNVVLSEDFETEKYTLPEGFSYIHDYSGGSVNADDKVLHITNNTDAQAYTTIGTTGIGVNGTTTQYELSFDYMILNRSSRPEFDFSLQLGSYCGTCEGVDDSHKFKGDTEYYLGSDAAKGVWYTKKATVSIGANCTNVYDHLYISAGAEILLDNIKFTDKNGNVAAEFNMDDGTLSGNIFSQNNPLNGAEIITKNQLLWINGMPNAVDGHLSVDTTDLRATYKAIDIDFEATQAIGATSYPTLTFDYKLSGTPNTTNGVAIAVSFNGITEPSYSRNFINLTDTNGEWVTANATTFTNLDIREGTNTLNLLVYGGMELEIDNIKLVKSGATVANIDFATNGTFEEASEEEVIHEIKDYGVLVDNTAATEERDHFSFFFHELGITDYPYAPAGNYTVEFDFYAIEEGFYRFIYSANIVGWAGEAVKSSYSSETKEIAKGEWKTVSIPITAIGEICYQKIYLFGGTKGYLDNFRLIGADGKVYTNYEFTADKVGGQKVDGADSATIVEIPSDIAAAKKDYAILADNTAATSATEYLSFFLHELDYNKHAKAPAGAYTVQFDFYALEEGNFRFIYSSNDSGWNGETSKVWSSESKEIAQGEWKTVTINVNASGEIGYQKLHLYGGIKGYLDNFKLIASDGTVYTDYQMTSKDLGKNCASGKVTIVAMPDDVKAAKNPVVVTGDNYDIKYIVDNVGIKTYGSNGVLKIAPSENKYYGINQANFGVNFVTGYKYRLSFDYEVTVPSAQNYYFAVTNINGDGNHDFINNHDELSGSLSYEFTYTGSLDLVVYGGGEVVFDNFLIEEYVEASSSEVLPAELQVVKRVSGAETYIDVIVNTSISSKNFTFDIGYDTDYVNCVQVSASEASANVDGKADDGIVAVTVNSTKKTWWGSTQAINGKIAALTFLVYEGKNDDITFTLSNFNGLDMEDVVSTVSINTVVSSLGILKREPSQDGAILAFGMNIRKNDGIEYVMDAEIATKGFLVVKGRHLDGELSFDAEYNPYVKNVVVETAENEYDKYNVYTLAVTAVPEDVIIAARPYIVDASGNTYYGEMITGTINDLANNNYNEWLTPEAEASATPFAISSKVAQTWQGANAISQGFIYTNGYTDEQIATELDRIDDMDIQMVRSYYDQTFSAYYDSASDSVKYNWDTEEMKGLVKWIKAMEERNVEVALNMCWALGDVWQNHCTTYTYDDCDATHTAGGIETSDNPFWCLRYVDGGSTRRAIDAYGDWVAASLDYLVNDCGLTNVKYLIMFTEPSQDYAADGSFTGQWTDYYKLVESANNALVAANLRDKFEMVGPNIGFTYDRNTSYINKMETFFSDGAAYNITKCIDIYSFHLYAPSWPDEGNYPDNPKDNNYDRYKEHFEQFIETVNKYDAGSDFWLDEWNYSGMFIDSEYYATQLAQAVVAALNSGVENVMLWQLFETKWPDRNDTGGEFVAGTHAMGLAPSLMESDVPYDVYYGYTLLTKYMGKRGATVYQGNGYDGIYSAMIENTDGTQSILVVNTNTTEKVMNLRVDVEINGTLFRHMYDPATVNPTAEAEIIKADKAFTDITGGLIDTLPAGAIAVYTTELSNIS